MKQRIVDWLEHQPKVVLLALSLGLSGLIGVIDLAVRADVSLSIFYLIPVAITTWFIGHRMGIVVAVLCTLAWFQADILTKNYTAAILPYWNATVRFGFFAIVIYLLMALREAYQREQQLARTDSLTRIHNRRFFLELLQIELDRAHRYHYPLTLAYLDVDNFKAVNDQFGHQAGDALLQKVAQMLQESIRSHDLAARLGGDEFAIALPQTHLPQAKEALTRTYNRLLTLTQAQAWPIGFSIGAITFVTLPPSVDVLISQTDQLMYEVKRSGKNRLECREYREH